MIQIIIGIESRSFGLFKDLSLIIINVCLYQYNNFLLRSIKYFDCEKIMLILVKK